MKNLTGLDLKSTDEAAQNDSKQKEITSSTVPKFTPGNPMTDVAMSRELLTKLQQEVK